MISESLKSLIPKKFLNLTFLAVSWKLPLPGIVCILTASGFTQ